MCVNAIVRELRWGMSGVCVCALTPLLESCAPVASTWLNKRTQDRSAEYASYLWWNVATTLARNFGEVQYALAVP